MSKSKRKTEEEDWRSTVFYWRGRIEPLTLEWEGVWVGSDSGTPSQPQFAESVNIFKTTLILDLDEKKTEHLRLDDIACCSGRFTECTYLLDQGEGHESFSDLSQNVSFSEVKDESGDRYSVVCACGDTEFGRFVSAGRATEDGEGHLTLLLARRYVRDQDPRSSNIDPQAMLESYSLQSYKRDLDADTELPWRVAKKKKTNT
jgi:hypothetical protein